MSKTAKLGFEKILLQGIWVGTYPYGYYVQPLEKRTKYFQRGKVLIDEQKKYHVQRIFDLYSTGNYSLPKVNKQLEQEGISIHTSKIHRILKNKFYAGIMTWKGKEYSHIYEPFIDLLLFNKCQKILNTNNKYFLYGDKYGSQEYLIPQKNVSVENKIYTVEQLMDLWSCGYEEACKKIMILMVEKKIKEKNENQWEIVT